MAAARIRDALESSKASSRAEVRAAGISPDLLTFRMDATHYARRVLAWQAQKSKVFLNLLGSIGYQWSTKWKKSAGRF
jgi:hypothetical protein